MIKCLKENKSFISKSNEEQFIENKKKDFHILPDGNKIEFKNEVTRACEILFAPEKIGLEIPCISIFLFFYFKIQILFPIFFF